MPFVGDIFAQLKAAADTPILREMRDGQVTTVTGGELLGLIAKARTFLASRKLNKGDRCGLLASNGIRWIAMDLAIMAEGLIVVPLYFRQAPAELASMMKDSAPSLVCCGDAALRDGIRQAWAEGPPAFLFDEIFQGVDGVVLDRLQVGVNDPVTIIYTSGTSGEAKGVVLTSANVTFMLDCTASRLDLLMEGSAGQDRIYHYLPFSFAASWIAMMTFLKRRSLVTLNTDLTKIATEMPEVAPDYFLNVPQLLERMRRAVDEQIAKKGGIAQAIYTRAQVAWARQLDKKSKAADAIWLGLAKRIVFPAVRTKMVGANLRALICGSAPLSPETQLWFRMMGIAVLQVYGLTETTAICTMDDPRRVPEPGRVGQAIPGIEMRLGESEEIVVRGPNIFPGYWNRPQQTAEAVREGWFHTGDQGEMDATGNWRIVGRIKNLIVLGSGHKISPEPMEEEIAQHLPGAQVVVVGNGRGYLSAIITGTATREQAQSALDAANAHFPHYKQVRNFQLRSEPFSIENGMLTANGKLKRDLISSRLKNEIDEMYRVKQAG